jgi:hypothetical protein
VNEVFALVQKEGSRIDKAGFNKADKRFNDNKSKKERA